MVVCALTGLLAMGACQPVDRLDLDDESAPEDTATGPGASGLPATLDELVERGDALAREWQREPVLAELAVSLDGERWKRARLLYLAGDADRFLSLRLEPDRVSQERVTLETLGLEPVPREALAAVPDLPAGTLAPAELVEAAQPHLDGCLEGPPSEVIYDTGAPATWEGEAWADPPVWSATLWHASAEGGGGQGRRVDPTTGEPVDELCAQVAP
jgi:hypothetical protein